MILDRLARGTPGLLVTLPIKTTNPLNGQTGNSRVASVIRSRARAEQHATAFMLVAAALKMRLDLRDGVDRYVVTLTRVSAGTMDTDGLAASQKGVRDGIAAALKIDDGDTHRLTFRYEQRKGPQKKHSVEVLIEEAQGG